ncbi:MAG TPA: glycosyltransferase [Casimicrobiaceae bacterium]|nr:glycosyltransferase [Casimicrobiaceae bacterium]
MQPAYDEHAPLRVLAITGNAIVGGMESAVLRLAQRLPAKDVRLTALCPFESPFTAALRECGVPVHVAPIGDRLRWHAIQFAVALVREHDVGVVHAHMPAAHAVAALAGRITRTPVLATIHAMHLSMQDLEAHRVARTHLCVVSGAARVHAQSVGVAPSRLTLIRNGVDSERFVPRPGIAAAGADAPPLVGYVGRLSPEKNPALFLHSAALVHARLPDVRFVVIGDGPLRAGLESLAARLRIGHVVTFAGECADMPARYAALDLMLLTSWHEGTPLAVLEAMSCALPIVATDVGGVPELVVCGTTGWLVPAGDAVAMAERAIGLLQDRDTMRRFGRAARDRASTAFTIDDQVRRTAALLRWLGREGMRSRGAALLQPRALATSRSDAAAVR